MSVLIQKRGSWQVIRVNGTIEVMIGKPTLHEVSKAIGCETIDSVKLDEKSRTIMLVDDVGMIDGKPVNPKATELYHSVCRPGTVFAIHGDVAIVNDKDFS